MTPFLLALPSQSHLPQDSQDLVLGGDVPISSIQATIAKLSIRPLGGLDSPAASLPSLVEPPGLPPASLPEPYLLPEVFLLPNPTLSGSPSPQFYEQSTPLLLGAFNACENGSQGLCQSQGNQMDSELQSLPCVVNITSTAETLNTQPWLRESALSILSDPQAPLCQGPAEITGGRVG